MAEAGVRGGSKFLDKSSAGDDMLRGPKSHSDDEVEERENRVPHGVHTLTTRAQIHVSASNEDIHSIDKLPKSNGVHAMETRSKFRTSAEDTDYRHIPPRHAEFHIFLAAVAV